MMPTMIRKTFSVPPLGCNCSIIGDPVTKQAIVVDPGGAHERILNEVHQLGFTVSHILHTHAHFDHFLASGEMKKATGATICLHQDDLELWKHLEMQCRMFGVAYVPVPMPDYWLKDEEKLLVGQVSAVALHTPGHTPGSTTFHLKGDRNILFTGDTLFMQSIGRTDLWGGSHQEILRSIEKKLMTFDDDTLVIAGHGKSTTIGHERRYNPFLK